MTKNYNSIRDIFSELVKQYSNPNYINIDGQNLIFMEYVWNFDDLKLLLENNFDINQTDHYGKTPIFYCKDKYQFRLLLLNGANINHVDNNNRNLLFTPNDLDNIRLILKLGINTNQLDNKGHTFLSHELFHQYPEVFVDYLDNFNDQTIEIFQIFDNSESCLETLNQHSIKYSLDKRIFFNYNPLKCKAKASMLLEYLNLSNDKDYHSELRFIYMNRP